MAYNLFLKILLIFAIITTFLISNIKPQMRKSAVIVDSAYNVVQMDINETQAPIQTVEEISVKKNSVQKKNKENIIKEPTKIIQNSKNTKEQIQKTKKIENSNQINVSRKEEIAWNAWRSRLQNQIMQDTKITQVPNGVVFKFKFTVDKYGKISNIQTWSLNPNYTPIAIQHIAPVIKNYQGRTILDFPNESNRVITDVEGGFKISNISRSTNPDSSWSFMQKK